MREKTIEQKFRAAVKAAGGLAVKFTSPGFDGVPDRFPGTGSFGSWDLKCMCWMMSRRLEG